MSRPHRTKATTPSPSAALPAGLAQRDPVGARDASEGQALAEQSPHNADKAAEYGRPAELRYTAGEHTVPPPGTPATALTTNQGVPIADNQSSLKAGVRGPTLLEDFILREKITHFDHERIPERVVHARGSAAHGYFVCDEGLRDVTRAVVLQKGQRTPVFVRFSTVAGERGSADTARDVRGFAVKFYTPEGNWDLVGNNIPVFFIQDAMKFPDLIHSVKPEPHNGIPQAASAHDTFWDFASLMPETTHTLCWVMSDRGIPRSLRMMQGFGVHTFRLVDAEGKGTFVKFHWTPKAGVHSLVWDEAVRISGADSDFHRRDLWDAIEAGAFPEWELGVQLFTEEQAEAWSFDVLDPTKLVHEELCPVRRVGRMVLDRNPDNFFAETEQVAFCTAHVVPGIDFSNDPLLAGRHHSYIDTQISRLGGANFHELPVNAPRVPVANNQRDGIHRMAVPKGRVAYEPNSLGGGCPFQAGMKGYVSYPAPIAEDHKLRGKPEKFSEHYAQARLFTASLSPVERAHMESAFRFELSKVNVPAIRQRMVAGLRHVDDAMATRLAQALGVALPEPLPLALATPPLQAEVDRSAKLSQTALPGDGNLATRKVAVLLADGVDGAALQPVVDALAAAGAVPRHVAMRLGTVDADGRPLAVDATFENSPSVLFDAVLVPADADSVAVLSALPAVCDFVKEQYRHGKAIALAGGEIAALAAFGIPLDADDADASAGIVTGARVAEGFKRAIAAHRHTARETDPPRV